MDTRLTDAQDIVLSKINGICNKFGLNNIMAQLYAILYFCGKPLSLDDMVDRLKISKGSASINIRALERYGAVKRVWVKGSRKDYYEAEADINKVIMDRIKSMTRSRLSEVDEMVSATASVVDSVTVVNNEEEFVIFKDRLNKVKELYNKAKHLFDLVEMGLLSESDEHAVQKKI